jgi:amino acid adenylation domain-containing protein
MIAMNACTTLTDSSSPVTTNLIHTAIEQQALKSPNAVAVEFDTTGTSITYGEMSAKSTAIAHAIGAATKDSGEQPLIAINTDRSLSMVVGVVGILKSGSAYVPIDPVYPLDRQEYIFKDSGCQVLVTGEEQKDSIVVKSALENGITVIALDTVGNVVSSSCKEPPTEPCADQMDSSLAYVIYTSGSTGKPKGVMVQHDNVMNMLRHFSDDLGVHNSTHSVLAVATFCFDISVFDMFLALTTGAKIVLASSTSQTDGFALLELIKAHPQLTVMQATPSTYEMLHTCGFTGGENLIAVSGGEPFRYHHFEKMRFKRFINAYGPTETTVYTGGVDVTVHNVGCHNVGKPMLNTTYHVFDTDGNEVPQGEQGELWIGGKNVTRGYLNRPELTAEKYKTFDRYDGERLYRSGDIGYLNEAGEYICKGRVDTQVKLRGFRIELGEVESEICKKAQGAVEMAIVVVRKDLPGGDGLVAYITLADGETDLDVEGVQARMTAAIPHYMVPRFFVTLTEFPMTSNFKVDKKQLPKPEVITAATSRVADHELPHTPAEKKVAAVFEQVLGMTAGSVGVLDSFFDLGGHSLLAMKVIGRLNKEAVDAITVVPGDALYATPTVEGLARALECACANNSGADAHTLPTMIRTEAGGSKIIASHAQEQMAVLWQTNPESPTYNCPYSVELTPTTTGGAVFSGAIRAAIQHVIRRHETLRTTLTVDPNTGRVVPHIATADTEEAEELFLWEERATSAKDVSKALSEAAAVPFDLAHGPVVRALLLRQVDGNQNKHWLQIGLHHAAVDGWSIKILKRELAVIYACLTSSGTLPSEAELPSPALQYTDYATWQHACEASPAGKASREAGLAYWCENLRHAPVLQLPLDFPRPARLSGRGAVIPLALPSGLVESVKRVASQNKCTPFMAFLAAWQLLLARYSREEEVVVGVPYAGRGIAETQDLIGYLVNPLSMRVQVLDEDGEDGTFTELLTRVRGCVHKALSHADVAFHEVVQALSEDGVAHDASTGRLGGSSPIFQTMLAYNEDAESQELSNECWGTAKDCWEVVDNGTAKFEATVRLESSPKQDGSLVGALEYSTDLFTAETASRMAEHYTCLLQSIAAEGAAGTVPLGALRMMSEAEEEKIKVEWTHARGLGRTRMEDQIEH